MYICVWERANLSFRIDYMKITVEWWMSIHNKMHTCSLVFQIRNWIKACFVVISEFGFEWKMLERPLLEVDDCSWHYFWKNKRIFVVVWLTFAHYNSRAQKRSVRGRFWSTKTLKNLKPREELTFVRRGVSRWSSLYNFNLTIHKTCFGPILYIDLKYFAWSWLRHAQYYITYIMEMVCVCVCVLC